jgi:hypothetical protein
LAAQVDTIAYHIDDLEAKVRSTLMSGGSTPISFSGEARIKMQYHNLGFGAPGFMQADRSYFQSGWEGNENMFRLGMVVRPGRNTILWSKIGLQHTMTGNRYYGAGNWQPPHNNSDLPNPGEGFVPYQYRHDKVHNNVTIHEDMSAGIAVRTDPVAFWVRMGNTMWTEASPLTVWKNQPRMFAWEYLPFEVEQSVAQYYEYNIARGEKTGPAAWNKKPFNGINVETINMPWGLYANFLYGTFERYDNFEREYIDFAGDLAYGDGAFGHFPSKAHGVGDSYRNIVHGRLAKDRAVGRLMLGLNYVGTRYKDDVIFAAKRDFGGSVANLYGQNDNAVYLLLREFRGYDSVFYKQTNVFSIDARGPVSDNFSIHADLAFSMVDTNWMIDPLGANRVTTGNHYDQRMSRPDWYEERDVTRSSLIPAFYTRLAYTGALPTSVDLAYIHPGFYSPFSFAVPKDAFFAFGSNMMGAGKFIARGEGAPYIQNMMGFNLTVAPTLPGYGHLRFQYGQHWNITEDGRDLLFFPYRLNGADQYSFFHSSFNRWGNSIIDNSVGPGPGAVGGDHNRFYKRRLGDESFIHQASYSTAQSGLPVAGPGMGGLRSDFMSMYEGFVAYNNAQEAWDNFRSRHMTANQYSAAPFSNTAAGQGNPANNGNPGYNSNLSTVFHHDLFYYNADSTVRHETSTSWVPTSRKFTNNIELGAAYDISPWLGYANDLFIGGHVGVNSVTRGSMAPIALPSSDPIDDNTLMWSFYMRLEPAIALTKNFYVLGLFGYETWRSDKSWTLINSANRDISASTPAIARTAARDLIRNPTTTRHHATTTNATQVSGPGEFVRLPIHTSDMALGIGFDWGILTRVGLHGRLKWMTHTDVGLNNFYDEVNEYRAARTGDGITDAHRAPLDFIDADRNDWKTPVISLELKTWF